MKQIKVLFSVILVGFLVLFSGCQESQSKEKAVQKVVEGYINALSTHDVQEIKKYVNAELQENLSNEDYVDAFVNTVVSCELIEVDTEQIQEIGNNQIEVPVKYVLTYSQDYVPVGKLVVGDNEMDYIFTLEEKENQCYVISHMRDALQQ